MADITNNYRPNNHQIHIMNEITPDNTSDWVARLATYVDSLQPIDIRGGTTAPITDPYDIDGPVIDIYINSPGGHLASLNSILYMLARARAKGARIRTNVMGSAASCASILAIMGDPGLRIMGENAYNLIHYGTKTRTIRSEAEEAMMFRDVNHHTKLIKQMYLDHTDIPQKKLNSMLQAETGYLYPDECLKLGVCDWILQNNGKLINRQR